MDWTGLINIITIIMMGKREIELPAIHRTKAFSGSCFQGPSAMDQPSCGQEGGGGQEGRREEEREGVRGREKGRGREGIGMCISHNRLGLDY